MTTNAVRDVALAGAEHGLCVVPPKENGSKQPETEYVARAKLVELFGEERGDQMLGGKRGKTTWVHFQRERPDRRKLERWYANGRTGVGFVCGAISGNLELFEFDEAATYRAYKALAEQLGLGDLVERIEAGYSSETPGGGTHWLYYCSEIAGNTKLARRPKRPEEMKDQDDRYQVLIETRGEGGYTVEAPSNGRVHPSGSQYRQLRGGVGSIATITPKERRELHRLARRFDQAKRAVFKDGASSSSAGWTKRPGDDFAARVTWAEILEPCGWEAVATAGDETFWKRPGSAHRWSATTNYQSSDLFYCFSTSTDFEAERGYNKFSAYAILNHDGDFTAAAREMTEKGYGEAATDDGSDGSDGERQRKSQADRLIGYALAALSELFVDQFGQAHALVNRQALALHRSAYPWLRMLFYEREGRGITGDTLQTVVGTLEARALAAGTMQELHVRSAWLDGALYVELGAGRVLRVSDRRYGIEPEAPVRFRRYPNLHRLPDPRPGGSLDGLLDLLPTKGEADRRLLRAYIVLVLLPVARPILLFVGPQGAGKTTGHRVIKRLVDPSKPESIRLDRDAVQKAAHAQVLLFDNLSHLPDWALDFLCRLVTGEADSKRRLYSDDDDVVYELQRAALLNGVNPPADRPDFNDRCLPIELERIPAEERKTERVLWRAFEEHHAEWLGAAFGLLARALAARPQMQLSWLPRLADWAEFAAAVYVAADDTAELFLRDWQEVVAKQHTTVIEGSPVAQAILVMMEGRAEWAGTPSQLYGDLQSPISNLKLETDRSWPRSSATLGKRLRELQPLLGDMGLRLHFERGGKARTITLRRMAESAVTPVTAVSANVEQAKSSDGSVPDVTAPVTAAECAVTPGHEWNDGSDSSDGSLGDSSGELLSLAERWQWRYLVVAGRGEFGGDEERWRKLLDFPPPFIGEVVEALRRCLEDERRLPF